MNASVLTIIVRLLLSLWLCWEIYKEAGPFTGIGFILLLVANELSAANMIYIRRLIDEIKLTGRQVINRKF